jgi:hypothetical protein
MCLPEKHKIILKNKVSMGMSFNIQYPALKSNDQINSIPVGYGITELMERPSQTLCRKQLEKVAKKREIPN